MTTDEQKKKNQLRLRMLLVLVFVLVAAGVGYYLYTRHEKSVDGFKTAPDWSPPEMPEQKFNFEFY